MNKSPDSKTLSSLSKKGYLLTDIMGTLKITRGDNQINSKLLTQENTSSAILSRVDSLLLE